MILYQGDGTGLTSIFGGGKFPDENFKLKHDAPGLLSMVSIFKFNSLKKFDWLDNNDILLPGKQWERHKRMPVLYYMCKM